MTPQERKAVIEATTTAAIDKAEKEKGHALHAKLYALKVENEGKYPEYDASDWFNIMMNLGKARSLDQKWKAGWSIDQYNENVFRVLSRYFTNDLSFEALDINFSLNKGLLLVGGMGSGKTIIMQLNSVNPKMSYSLHDCREIANEFMQGKSEAGNKIIEGYASIHKSKVPSKVFGQNYLTRLFDDLGAEGVVKHYGNEKNVMAEIIQSAYKKFQQGYAAPHFTTNLMPHELATYYDPRVLDRINEMCNIIIFPQAPSRRLLL